MRLRPNDRAVLGALPAGRSVRASASLRFEDPVVLAGGRHAFASDHLAVEAEFII